MSDYGYRIVAGLEQLIIDPPMPYKTLTGDTLKSISTAFYGVDSYATQLATYNHIQTTKANNLPAGLLLQIPFGRAQAASQTTLDFYLQRAHLRRGLVFARDALRYAGYGSPDALILQARVAKVIALASGQLLTQQPQLDLQLYLAPYARLFRDAAAWLRINAPYTVGSGRFALSPAAVAALTQLEAVDVAFGDINFSLDSAWQTLVLPNSFIWGVAT